MEVSSQEIEKYLANSSLRTSVGADWGPLTVRIRVEPPHCNYLRIPATPDPWLVLTTGGAPRKTEVRGRNGWRSDVSGPGNLALTSPGKSTEIRWDGGDGGGVETIHVCIDAALFYRFAAENFRCDPSKVEIIDGFAHHDPLISSIIHSLGEELRNPDLAGTLFRDSAAQMLVSQLFRKFCAFPLNSHGEKARMSPRTLRLAKDYMHARLADKLTLEEIARSIHMSAFHFARVFRATTGDTPHAYLTRARIERAQELLRNSSSPISVVARRVGFSSKSHFAATFNRATGVTPYLFRKAVAIPQFEDE